MSIFYESKSVSRPRTTKYCEVCGEALDGFHYMCKEEGTWDEHRFCEECLSKVENICSQCECYKKSYEASGEYISAEADGCPGFGWCPRIEQNDVTIPLEDVEED